MDKSDGSMFKAERTERNHERNMPNRHEALNDLANAAAEANRRQAVRQSAHAEARRARAVRAPRRRRLPVNWLGFLGFLGGAFGGLTGSLLGVTLSLLAILLGAREPRKFGGIGLPVLGLIVSMMSLVFALRGIAAWWAVVKILAPH